MKCFAFVLLIFSPLPGSDSDCPVNGICKSTLNRWSCPENTYYQENRKSNNCCPNCVNLHDLGERCDEDKDCAPGLSCEVTYKPPKKRCSHNSAQACEYYKRNDEDWIRTKYWKPDCLSDGKYAEKQCKGEKLTGKCFCTNEDGVRIFGEKPWIYAENMTCACSRHTEKIRRLRKDVSLHCNDDGNFEALQCDNGICWCANERTGIPFTPVVPESMSRILPCFEEENFGSQYLRRCDSVHVQTQRAVKILENHGLIEALLPTVNCNYDGSYGRFQMKGNKGYCASKNLTKLTDNFDGIKDCNCAYDRFVAKNAAKDFNFECDNFGCYKPDQVFGNTKFQVDSDGCMYDIHRTN